MARYAVAVHFRINTSAWTESPIQIYIIQADTQTEAEERGAYYADEFCIKEGEPEGAEILSVVSEQIPDVA